MLWPVAYVHLASQNKSGKYHNIKLNGRYPKHALLGCSYLSSVCWDDYSEELNTSPGLLFDEICLHTAMELLVVLIFNLFEKFFFDNLLRFVNFLPHLVLLKIVTAFLL